MRDFKDDLRSAGYSQEEAYFYKLNQKLIRDMKRKLEAERKQANGMSKPSEVIDFDEEYDFDKAA